MTTTDKHINDLLKEADLNFDKFYSAQELKLLRFYRLASDRVKQKIALIFEDYGNKPTITELYKYNRLQGIEKQLTEEIRNLTRISANVISGATKESYINSYYSTGFALEVGSGVQLGFTMLPKSSIEYAVSDNLWLDALKNDSSDLLTKTKRAFEEVLRANAREEVVSGLAEGKPYSKVAKVIEERFNIAATRSKMITFTEMHKSHSRGRVEGLDTATSAADELGLKSFKVWKHNNAAKTPRPDHIGADNQPSDKNGMFHVGGEELAGPGLGTDPKNNIYCHCTAEFHIEGIDEMPKDKELMGFKNMSEYQNFLHTKRLAA